MEGVCVFTERQSGTRRDGGVRARSCRAAAAGRWPKPNDFRAELSGSGLSRCVGVVCEPGRTRDDAGLAAGPPGLDVTRLTGVTPDRRCLVGSRTAPNGCNVSTADFVVIFALSSVLARLIDDWSHESVFAPSADPTTCARGGGGTESESREVALPCRNVVRVLRFILSALRRRDFAEVGSVVCVSVMWQRLFADGQIRRDLPRAKTTPSPTGPDSGPIECQQRGRETPAAPSWVTFCYLTTIT